MPPAGSVEFSDVLVQIYDLGGTGIAGLGSFAAAVPLFSQTYATSDGSLFVTDTGDDMSAGIVDGDIMRYEAVGTVLDLGPGNFGLFITFPNATTQSAGWATAAPTGATECMTGWGASQDTPSTDACSVVGAAFENAAFRLLGAP